MEGVGGMPGVDVRVCDEDGDEDGGSVFEEIVVDVLVCAEIGELEGLDEVEDVVGVVDEEVDDELDTTVLLDSVIDELNAVELTTLLLAPPLNPKAYRFSLLPAPQYSLALPLQGILHSVAKVGTLPAPRPFPQ